MPSFRAVGGPCLEVSLGMWERDPDLDQFFFRSKMTSCSESQKVDTALGQTPASQARPRDTDHLRPSNLAARTLRSVEHKLSKFGHDPCPVRRGLVAAVKWFVRRDGSFRCPGRLWNREREARAKGENLFCFLFSDSIIVSLSTR